MEQPGFDKELHIKYWNRCFKSILPTGYTTTDSSRISLGFFILSALDLLGAGADTLDPKDVAGLKKWILNCEHPNGGFCGSPNHKYPKQYYRNMTSSPPDMDPANLPATFFALLALNFVGKIGEADRTKCLKWLRKMQREDGSFGETLGKDGKIEGGRDMRYCHCAASIRWMLRGDLKAESQTEVEDIDVDGLMRHIQRAETYDGGFGESFEHESHAGYTYCALASLSNLDRLPGSLSKSRTKPNTPDPKPTLVANIQNTTRWLMSRQVVYKDIEGEGDKEPETNPTEISSHSVDNGMAQLAVDGLSLTDSFSIGCNGRLNKVPDTCYSFWVDASLYILGQSKLINKDGSRRWLIEQTQHMIGGFGKEPGYPPDIYHSYLGLSVLAMLGEPNLKPFDPVLCASQDAKSKIERDIAELLGPEELGKSVWDNIDLMPSNMVQIGPNDEFPKFWTDAEAEFKKMQEDGTFPLLEFESNNITSGL